MINVLAIDPGLRRFGAVMVKTDGARHDCVRVDVFESEQRADDFDIRLAEDRVRRTRDLSRWLRTFADGECVDIIAAEAMSFPRGAHAIVAISLSWGVVADFAERRGLRIIAATPSQWRTALIGRPSRSRAKGDTDSRELAAHAESVRRVPSFVDLAAELRPDERQVHALDALGVFCWLTTVRAFVDMLGGIPCAVCGVPFPATRGARCCSQRCRQHQWNARHEGDPSTWARRMTNAARARAGELGVPFDLDVDDVVRAFDAQHGRCAISGLSFEWSRDRSPRCPSLDRILPERGYVRGNVQVVLYAINIGKWTWAIDDVLPIWSEVARRASRRSAS